MMKRLELAAGIAEYPESTVAHLMECHLPVFEGFEIEERRLQNGFLVIVIDLEEYEKDCGPTDDLVGELIGNIKWSVDELAAVDIDGEL